MLFKSSLFVYMHTESYSLIHRYSTKKRDTREKHKCRIDAYHEYETILHLILHIYKNISIFVLSLQFLMISPLIMSQPNILFWQEIHQIKEAKCFQYTVSEWLYSNIQYSKSPPSHSTLAESSHPWKYCSIFNYNPRESDQWNDWNNYMISYESTVGSWILF